MLYTQVLVVLLILVAGGWNCDADKLTAEVWRGRMRVRRQYFGAVVSGDCGHLRQPPSHRARERDCPSLPRRTLYARVGDLWGVWSMNSLCLHIILLFHGVTILVRSGAGVEVSKIVTLLVRGGAGA